MLVTLLVWIYIFLSSFSLGTFAKKILGKLAGTEVSFAPVITSLTGIISLTIILGYCSLFTGVDTVAVQVCIFLLTLTGLFLFRKDYASVAREMATAFADANWLRKSLLVIFSLFILIKTSGQVQSLDSGQYHLPFIKWVASHHVITGLANVHSRFGFNYHYHLLYAFYAFAGIAGTTLHALNGYLFLTGFFYLYQMFSDSKSLPLHRTVAILALLYVSQINKGMTGFSPDFPVAIIQAIIVLECLKYLEIRKSGNLEPKSEQAFILSILLLTFGAITLKLATVSVLFVVIVTLFRKLFTARIIVAGALLSVIIFTPYLVRNYLISGYVVYPFYAVDIFHVPWKVPLARTIDEKVVIKNFALGTPYYYKGGYTYDLALMKGWLKNMAMINKAYPPIIAAIAGCLLITLFKWIAAMVSKKTARLLSPVNMIQYGLVAGIIFWFLNAPDPRFGNGIIIPFIAITLAGVAGTPALQRITKPLYTFLILAIIGSSILSLSGRAVSQTVYQTNDVTINWLIQEKYPQPDTTLLLVDGIRTYRAKERCWDCPVPCSYPNIDSFIFIEPGNIEKGFLPR